MQTGSAKSLIPFPWRQTLPCVFSTLALSLAALALFGSDGAASNYFALHRGDDPEMTAAMTWFSSYGNVPFYCYYAVMFFVQLKRRRAGGYRLILASTAGFVAATLASSLLKFCIGRPRPYMVGDYTPFTLNSGYLSFPSGHVTESSICALQIANHHGRMSLSIVLGIPPMIMAVSRLYLGAHYPTDLIGGVLVGYLGSRVAWRLASRKTSAT